MKRLNSVENEQVQLEIIECDCGFHLGIDATWLDQCNSDNATTICPNCKKQIPIDSITNENILETWFDNNIQFPRLLSEIVATGTLSESHMKELCDSMDLTIEQIDEIFERAQIIWERIKKYCR